ncbi:MAG: NADH-ubiquinone oxidoreductase-F iron-sulfur binding region domain-containing protein [Ectothiorhodospiraceae bacterium]|jgi:NADH:ubiquinone oxidoreductase subunit F (NADH-binding)
MKLLRRMEALQEAEGAVTDDGLRRLAKEEGVPLYRLEGLRSFYPVFREHPGAPVQVHVCRDVVCRMSGGADHCRKVREALTGREDVEVSEVSCLGLCDSAPAAAINDRPVTGDAAAIAAYATGSRELPAEEPPRPGNRRPTDPYDCADDHYGILRELLTGRSADDVIQALKDADLRGLGGAAFPTGMKWDFTRRAAGETKYVVCNADESEPGTFKDRALLEEQPHLVVEGMAIGAWVIGARRGIVYLRHEYGRARRALQAAIDDAYARGVLGKSAFGTGGAFDLEIFVSPGGYILGEETALLEALEDKRGEPRNKPPFPTNVGLDGKPTLINNVETLAAVPVILRRGAEWWADQGKGDHKGLKYVSVSGDVNAPGVYCVPWGTTAGEVLELCGGVAHGRALKAFSPGGASTAFLPADRLDTPLDFQAMQQAGSGLGTGAMVFVAEHRDLMDVTLSQVRFFRNESCGKCVPCRIGSRKAVEMVEAVMAGRANGATGAELTELHRTLAKTSICGLGQVALLPLVDALEKFPGEPSLARLNGGDE